MDLRQIVKEVLLGLIQNNNHICEHFFWNERRQKFYCNCYKGFMIFPEICAVYRCIACKNVDNCRYAPCDDICAIDTELNLDI